MFASRTRRSRSSAKGNRTSSGQCRLLECFSPEQSFHFPCRRPEEHQEKQRRMETAFEQVYQDQHRKRTPHRRNKRQRWISLSLEPIPIVLINESDRTLIDQDEQEEEKDSSEYRMARGTP